MGKLYDLACKGFNKKIEHLQYSIFFVEVIALQGDISFRKFLLKMATVKLTMVTSLVKGFHVYRGSPDIGEKVKCTGRNKQTQQHSNQSCWGRQ